MATMYDANWYKQARFKTHDLELDSLKITDMINNKIINYHKLKGIRDIFKDINGANMKISHF